MFEMRQRQRSTAAGSQRSGRRRRPGQGRWEAIYVGDAVVQAIDDRYSGLFNKYRWNSLKYLGFGFILVGADLSCTLARRNLYFSAVVIDIAIMVDKQDEHFIWICS